MLIKRGFFNGYRFPNILKRTIHFENLLLLYWENENSQESKYYNVVLLDNLLGYKSKDI